ncbi:aromatase [Amycolatopsis pretoriensis]|uniref:Aromatase n=1 Tax=Amycolatopsis pretoriensis TaxID=218821 RepID=A0A1H5QMD0_9PSEU|nr:aromatase/cyclase [Amycolatopsis pretoriensis]SEF26528.1 aromatase [Amycolatopsis pretoriensis]
MTLSGRHGTQHEITVAAAAGSVYRLLADVRQWPHVFPPTVHVDRLEGDERTERIRIWATANGVVKNWISRRDLFPEELRIAFRQEVSAAPIASMGGEWIIGTTGDGQSRVRLVHDYEAVSPEEVAWIEETVDRNSRAELEALRTHLEAARAGEELAFSFEDTVEVDGGAQDVYDFIDRADLWPERLPHVAKVKLVREPDGVQTLEMDTRAHGATHTTKSYRVPLPNHCLAYKQVTLPSLLSVHTGCWTVAPRDGGVTVSSQHTVVLDAGNIAPVLGEDAAVSDARKHVQDALSGNSRVTLEHAKQYAEARRR